MKRLLLATTACCGLAAAAQAADLPYRAAPPVYTPPPFTWTGFYVGVNAGYGFGHRNDDHDHFFPSSVTLGPSGDPRFTAVGPAFPGATGVGVVPLEDGVAADGIATPATVPLQNWCGFGGVGGVAGFGGANGCNDRDNSGFVGGGQIGYNLQLTPGAGFVIGVEADIQFAGLNRHRDQQFWNFGQTFPDEQLGGPDIPIPGVLTAAGVPVSAEAANAPVDCDAGTSACTVTFFDPRRRQRQGIDWFGTLRARVGYAFDRVLVYATGGLAYGGGKRDDQNWGNWGGTTTGFSWGGNCGWDNDCNRIRVGWTAGAGLEYAFTNNLSVKVEGLYVSLGDHRNDCWACGGQIQYAVDSNGNRYLADASAFNNTFWNSRRREGEFAVVRAGINYKFGWDAPPAPVVARY